MVNLIHSFIDKTKVIIIILIYKSCKKLVLKKNRRQKSDKCIFLEHGSAAGYK